MQSCLDGYPLKPPASRMQGSRRSRSAPKVGGGWNRSSETSDPPRVGWVLFNWSGAILPRVLPVYVYSGTVYSIYSTVYVRIFDSSIPHTCKLSRSTKLTIGPKIFIFERHVIFVVIGLELYIIIVVFTARVWDFDNGIVGYCRRSSVDGLLRHSGSFRQHWKVFHLQNYLRWLQVA